MEDGFAPKGPPASAGCKRDSRQYLSVKGILRDHRGNSRSITTIRIDGRVISSRASERRLYDIDGVVTRRIAADS